MAIDSAGIDFRRLYRHFHVRREPRGAFALRVFTDVEPYTMFGALTRLTLKESP